MFEQYVTVKRAFLASMLMVSFPITFYFIQPNVVFGKDEEEEKRSDIEGSVQEEEMATEVNVPPVAMYPSTGHSTNNFYDSCMNLDRFANSFIIGQCYERNITQQNKPVIGSTSSVTGRSNMKAVNDGIPITECLPNEVLAQVGSSCSQSPLDNDNKRIGNSGSSSNKHVGESQEGAHQWNDDEMQPMWKVDVEGNSTNGLLNAEQEVVMYFDDPIQFEEAGDKDVNDAVQQGTQANEGCRDD